jgi:hypothetical protein
MVFHGHFRRFSFSELRGSINGLLFDANHSRSRTCLADAATHEIVRRARAANRQSLWVGAATRVVPLNGSLV